MLGVEYGKPLPFTLPQCSILGPLLFIIYTNDLPDYCNDLHTKLYTYADDPKLYRHIFNTADQDNLQNVIHRLNDWANEWQLKLNVDKCCGMTHTASISNLGNTKYYTDNGNVHYELANTESVSDLGVRVDSKVSFVDHINDKVNKAIKAYSILGIIKRNFIHFDINSFVLLCKAMVIPHLEYANFVWCPYKKGDIEIIEKVQERATTKLIISLKKLSYVERLKQLQLPTLKYRRLRGDMIEVFKIVHNYYDSEAAVKLNFNTFNTTRGMYKLQKFMCHYNIRKYSFCARVVNIWNSLPNEVVEADTVNAFKYRLDKHWSNQDVLFNFNADFTGARSVPICM